MTYSDIEICCLCGLIVHDDDLVYLEDTEGTFVHAECCSDDPRAYTDPDGNALKAGDPIPPPIRYGGGPVILSS